MHANPLQPHFSEAERPAILSEATLRLDVMWLKAQIGEATYLRSLFIQGFLPDEARTRLRLLKMEKARG